ncbi:RDD family protein [Radiobacillus sp. PE A8.2]|uniref:RDD family protein n=1 Tax=Radiobacillus sp. PE A8.2 TaxID=3380349 RepID=UPI00388E3E5A
MDQEQLDIKTPEYVSLRFKSAGLGSRSAAFLIDQGIVMVANILFVVVLSIIMSGQWSQIFLYEMNSFVIGISILVLFLINWGYFFILEYFFGGKTIGKRVIGIRVIQDNGHSITLLSSFIRNLLRIIDQLPANYLLGIALIFFHSKHKRLGDIVAGTVVVHERRAKQKKKLSALAKEIERRGLSKQDLQLEEWTINQMQPKDWKLIRTYTDRLLGLPILERNRMTRQVASIIFPKIGLDIAGRSVEDLENVILVVYLYLKDEYEFEL